MESDILFEISTSPGFRACLTRDYSELAHSVGGTDPEVLAQDRLKEGRERLDNALETSRPAVRARGAAQGRAGAHITTEGQYAHRYSWRRGTGVSH
jgi:hypothetical protein